MGVGEAAAACSEAGAEALSCTATAVAASNEQRERADLQRDEARVHADMVRSEATEAAAIRAAIDAARRDVEELARDEKHERYTIHEDEREARRHILQKACCAPASCLQAMDTAVAEFTAGAAWIAHEEQMARTTLAQAERIEQQVVAQSRAQSQQREDSESVQRDLETMNIALELTAAATASRARMALVVAEELRARDVLCGEEASDRTMYAAEERRARGMWPHGSRRGSCCLFGRLCSGSALSWHCASS
ncbi:hypothetical protein ERJ75_000029700 [Trypanosoma vivax]|nr:hypothetical protein ERJ75_000029700 [Trypanosoma vivax]